MVKGMLVCMMALSGYPTSIRTVGMYMAIKRSVDKIQNFIDIMDNIWGNIKLIKRYQ